MTHPPQIRARDAVLALDVGGTKLAAGVVRGNGEVRSFVTCPTDIAGGPEASLARLFDLGKHALDQAGVEPGDAPARLLGCGIGCGGPLDSARGVVLCPPHLPGWVDVPITRLAESTYGLPAVLDNDGTAGAAGEWRFGAGRGTRHLAYLTVSTGIGGGFVVDGRTYRGAAGNGGEPGHITVRSEGRPCRGCGRTGCLEAYASGTSLGELAREAVGRGEYTSLPQDATAADVAREARAGDPLAARLWDEATALLGQGVTSIVNLYEPEVVVLGGGVTRAGEQLLAPVRSAVAGLAMRPAARAVRVVPAANGDRAGVLGAAAIAFERLVGTVDVPHVYDEGELN
ncbi:ROK family protein [Streptomyces sp. NPDC086077]|uniref:ROK family protein n=1 Tax=Streptomyces sp. NPDC086077 TaxID=3154862 RepID=UPI00343C54BD